MNQDANHRPGMVCSRYGCNRSGAIDTAMGMMCREHSSPLLFQVQTPRGRGDLFIPWEFIAPCDLRARINHGGQTLARLSERGGLSIDEVCAVLSDREWRSMDPVAARAELERRLTTWRAGS